MHKDAVFRASFTCIYTPLHLVTVGKLWASVSGALSIAAALPPPSPTAVPPTSAHTPAPGGRSGGPSSSIHLGRMAALQMQGPSYGFTADHLGSIIQKIQKTC